jgi:hypothetical protein
MSEPILERLNRFTPDAGRLDRDALLFAAGRDSARPNRGWMTLATLLASTQALSLALLWPRPTPPGAGLPAQVAAAPVPSAVVEPTDSDAMAHPGLWSAGRGLREMETDDRPASDVTFIETGPPLRAFPPPASLLN